MSQQNDSRNFIVGICTLIACHIAYLALGSLILFLFSWLKLPGALDIYINSPSNFGSLLLLSILFIGLTQIVYVVPLLLWLKRRGRADTAEGVTVGAVITALLNGSCFLLFNAAVS